MTALKQTSHSSRILEYLAWAEQNEPDVWLRDDLRIAWITVRFAELGYANPFVLATQQVLGIHPDKLQAAIEARRRAKLGALYDNFALNLPPKKPAASVRLPSWRVKVGGE